MMTPFNRAANQAARSERGGAKWIQLPRRVTDDALTFASEKVHVSVLSDLLLD